MATFRSKRLLGAGDRRHAARLVHDLCGMASMVRAMEMAHLAAAAENAIGKEDQVPELLAELPSGFGTRFAPRAELMAGTKIAPPTQLT